MASIEQRGKRWRIRFLNRHGRHQWKTTRAKNGTEAQRLADDKERAEERYRLGSEKPIKPDMPFGAATKLYIAALPPDYVSRDSLVGRLNNRILPYLSKKMCREMTPADVKGMLNGKKTPPAAERDLVPNAKLAAETREKLRVATSGVFTYLIDDLKHWDGVPGVPENPAAQVPKYEGDNQLPKFLELHEVPLLMEKVHLPRRMEFLFSVATGVRKGEHFGLRREDLRLERQLAFINRSHDRNTTKGGEGRPVPLPRWLLPLLKEHLESHTSPWVFPDRKGRQQKKWVKLHLVMRTAMKRAGLVTGYTAKCVTRGKRKSCGFAEERREPGESLCPCGKRLSIQGIPRRVTFHGLRHTFGTWALAQGGNVRHVQAVMGHADLRTTDIYAKVLSQHLVGMSDRMDLGLGTTVGQARGALVARTDSSGSVVLPQPSEMTLEDSR